MALVRELEAVPAEAVGGAGGAEGVHKRILIGPQDGAPTFAVRLFSVQAGGHTPRHSHPFEHGVVVLKGSGELVSPEGSIPLRAGHVAYVPPGELHQFRNTGEGAFEFLCVVPRHVEL
ncbi:MAG: cupin domain-containing protein [Candidatus Bipolaricaulaceae bacterium]